MTTRAPSHPTLAIAALAFGLLALGGLAAFGATGWIRHGERLWLAMAEGAWAFCF